MKVTRLGELEKQVMEIIWNEKSCSSRDVLTKLPSEKTHAYTTIATIVQRLYEKGLLKREKHHSGFIYSPKITREEYTKDVAQSFLSNFINNFGDIAIASFADSVDALPSKKRQYFLKLLEEHDKK